MKKYKLKIPEMIRREDAWIAHELICAGFDANCYKLVKEDLYLHGAEGSFCFTDIPSDWLEEIKDEPMSAEEYLKSVYDAFTDRREGNRIKKAFNAGAAEERKKFRATQTFEEWWNSCTLPPGTPKYTAGVGWNACLKAHNLEYKK